MSFDPDVFEAFERAGWNPRLSGAVRAGKLDRSLPAVLASGGRSR